MSRSPSKVLSISIGAGELALGLRPAWYRRLYVTLRPGQGNPPGDHPPAMPGTAGGSVRIALPDGQHYTEQGAVEALRQALSTDLAAAAGRADIHLDDFWAHHAILRGDFRAMRTQELEEIVQAYFTDTFALEAEALCIRWQVQKFGQALFASAISRSLQESVLATAAAAGIRVVGLAPGLPLLLNRLRHALDGRSSMLVVVAESMLHTVMLERNRWVAYDTHRLFPGESSDAGRLAGIAESLFERSAILAPETCRIYWCGQVPEPLPAMQRFAGIFRLPGLPSGEVPS